MKNKILSTILILFIILNQINISFATEEIQTENIDGEENEMIYSEGACLMEMGTGKVLFEKNMNKRLYPASVTKILTAILAIENCDLNDKAEASVNAISTIPDGYTVAAIKPGEKFTVEQLLEVLMLRSANEAATILAEHISGSVEDFAVLMNNKAKEIGCLDTNFVNGNGIHDENHYSTAYDMALIQRYCMQNEEYRRISNLKECSLPDTELYEGEPRIFKNTHGMLLPDNKNYYKYVISGKTGFTTPAKNCLITSSNKNGFELIAVVLHAEGTIDGISARYYDTKNLLDYGYENYRLSSFLKKGTIIDTIELETEDKKKEELNLLLENDINLICEKEKALSKDEGIVELKNIELPIVQGDVLGTVKYNINGVEYKENLIAENTIESNSTIAEIRLQSNNNKEIFIILILSVLIILAIGVIIAFIVIWRKDKKAKPNLVN